MRHLLLIEELHELGDDAQLDDALEHRVAARRAKHEAEVVDLELLLFEGRPQLARDADAREQLGELRYR